MNAHSTRHVHETTQPKLSHLQLRSELDEARQRRRLALSLLACGRLGCLARGLLALLLLQALPDIAGRRALLALDNILPALVNN